MLKGLLDGNFGLLLFALSQSFLAKESFIRLYVLKLSLVCLWSITSSFMLFFSFSFSLVFIFNVKIRVARQKKR